MPNGTLTYTTNLDGTICIKADGKDVRYAKESDLLEVKGASDTARKQYDEATTKHQTEMAEANRVRDEGHTELLKERAAKELLEKQVEETATLRTKVGELEQSVTAAGEGRKQLEDELLGVRRASFGARYKTDPEKVKTMTLDQLREADKTLDLIGFAPTPTQPANYDGKGSGGDGASAPQTELEKAKEEIRVTRENQAKQRAGISSPTQL